MKRVVVGTGYTGGRVLAALGGDACGYSRRGAGSGTGVLTLDLDSSDPQAPGLPPGCALLYTVPPARDTEDDRRLQLLLSLLEPPPARFVYISTSGVYGDCDGRLVNEDATTHPATARARRRLAAERAAAGWCEARAVALVILRVPGIYGPGRLGLERIRSGEAVIAADEAPPGNRIHVDDLVACCLAALEPVCPPGVYNVGDGDHRSSSAFRRDVARLAGLPAPPEVPLAEAMATFSETRLSFLRESRRLDNRRMREVLGVEPRYADPEDGIRASL